MGNALAQAAAVGSSLGLPLHVPGGDGSQTRCRARCSRRLPSTFSNWRAVFGSTGRLASNDLADELRGTAAAACELGMGDTLGLRVVPQGPTPAGSRSPAGTGWSPWPSFSSLDSLARAACWRLSGSRRLPLMVIAVTWLMSMPPSSVRGTGSWFGSKTSRNGWTRSTAYWPLLLPVSRCRRSGGLVGTRASVRAFLRTARRIWMVRAIRSPYSLARALPELKVLASLRVLKAMSKWASLFRYPNGNEIPA